MTIEEIQYEAQGIMQEWGSNDSAPYVEFVEKLASMELPEPQSVLDEAAKEYNRNYIPFDQCDSRDIWNAFKAGAEWVTGQGKSIVAKIGLATKEICCTISEETLDSLGVRADDEVIIQIRKK